MKRGTAALWAEGHDHPWGRKVEEVIHQHKAVMDVQVSFCMAFALFLIHDSTGRCCGEHADGLRTPDTTASVKGRHDV